MRNRKSIAVLVALAFVITLMTAVGAVGARRNQGPSGTGSAGSEAKGPGRRQYPQRRFVQSPGSWRRRDFGAHDRQDQGHLARDEQKCLPRDLHHARSAFAGPGKGRCRG